MFIKDQDVANAADEAKLVFELVKISLIIYK